MDQNQNDSITDRVKGSQRVFHGVRFDVHAVQLPGREGNKVRREFVAHPGAVVILPILDHDRIVMIRNYRFVVEKELWELPAGTLEPNEPPEKTAYRELIEETGYKAEAITPLINFYTTPGFCNEVMYAYVARGLTAVGQNLDDSEQITVEIKTWDEVLRMVQEGKICDAKTLTALLFYNSFFQK